MPEGQAFEVLQSQADRATVRNQAGLVAAKTGTTDTAVTSWAAGTVTTGPDSIEAVQTAANGTVVRIRTAGRYRCEFGCTKLGDGDTTLTLGLSRDVAAGGLNTAPAFATAGMLIVLPTVLPAATASTVSLFYSSDIEVSPLQARQVVGGIQGVLVRFHAFGAAGAPAAGLPATPAWYFVERIGDAVA